MRKRSRPHLSLTLAAAAMIAALAGCGEKAEPDLGSLTQEPGTDATTTATVPTTTAPDAAAPAGDEEPEAEAPGPGAILAREAEHTARAYITWIDRGQGSRLCALIDEDALERLRLPVRRGGCGRSLSASIGFRNPRGLPVFDGVTLREVAARVRGRRARVVATVSVRFGDRPAPSIEDDVIYLERRRGSWVVAKPSATLYRAIGAEVPPAAIAPPRS